VKFDWSSRHNAEPCVQWAAFYSDCEHEVLPVTTGNRITLTYNLFASRGAGKLAGGQNINADPKTLPLYQSLQDALASPSFMRKAGKLGVYLSHNYPFTHSTLFRTVRPALKGVDMALYETLKVAGLGFRLVRDVKGGYGGFYDDFDEFEDEYDEYEYDEDYDEDENTNDDTDGELDAKSEYPWLQKREGGMYLKGFAPVKTTGAMIEDPTELLGQKYGGEQYRAEDVLWLNNRNNSELSYAYLAVSLTDCQCVV